MTRSRLLAGAAVLLLGVACGRLGAPVRSAHPPRQAGASSPALPGVETPQSPADEEEVEKR